MENSDTKLIFFCGCVKFLARFLVRIAESAEDAEDAERTLIHSSFLSQDEVILAKTLFFRALCVLRVIRDSDRYFCQNRGKRECFYTECATDWLRQMISRHFIAWDDGFVAQSRMNVLQIDYDKWWTDTLSHGMAGCVAQSRWMCYGLRKQNS